MNIKQQYFRRLEFLKNEFIDNFGSLGGLTRPVYLALYFYAVYAYL